MTIQEINFDGLVGPTHHFGGLGVGNLASRQHGGHVARPQAAALTGLRKMQRVAACGAPQFVLPPQSRPDLDFLRAIGFSGPTQSLLAEAAEQAPRLLAAAWSASAMWTANAATVTAAPDSRDGRLHLSVANLTSSTHRSLEPGQTHRRLSQIFSPTSAAVHGPLPSTWGLRDEGAANHMRLFDDSGTRGVELFVWGADRETNDPTLSTSPHPARQTLEASRAIARRHRSHNAIFLRQDPRAIAAGAFHNDVVATSCRNVLLAHERALADLDALDAVAETYRRVCGQTLHVELVREEALPLAEAVACYLFNSQLIVDAARPGDAMTLVCPSQVADSPAATAVAERWLDGPGPIENVVYVDLQESMSNGGGPACLRLRVPMDAAQSASLPQALRLDDSLAERLEEVIERTYPEEITAEDLAREELVEHCQEAYRAVCEVLEMIP
ncbi:N-succinylarginine dihydrolase [Roseimaritima sediminicola]|uniref:N-succinylarginine dihydrolase n=1 Tax=Roseimaritima sediminicola TaxID=2662066 RepID=UPI00129855B1|nr:N-succinylarginine dihydrolase [Roseimaritima sediminicola]